MYLSNESEYTDMFFDNLTVQHYTGPLVEETQYYPFGLTMAGISSKAFGRLDNKKKYQGYEYNTDFDLNLYESFYRTHDPQLGRFWQVDPKPNYDISPYAVMDNNPICNIDPLGDTSINGQKMEGGNAASATFLPTVTVTVTKKYVPEQDFLHNPMTLYNSKTEKGFTLSNDATVKSLATDFLANYECTRCHNTIIVGGVLLNDVKN